MNHPQSGLLPDEIPGLLSLAASNLNLNVSVSHQAAARALQLAVQHNNIQKAGEAALLKGKAEYLSRNKTAALKYFETAREYAEAAGDDKTSATAWNNIGLIHFEKTEWKEAENCYTHSLSIKEKNADEKGIGISCQNLGVVYNKTGRYPEALHHYTRARKIFEKLDEQSHLAIVIYNSGSIYSSDENYAEALECFMTALNIARTANDTISLINIYINIGDVKHELGEYEESERYLQLSLQMSREQGYGDGVTASLANLCGLFYVRGDYEKTLHYGTAVIEYEGEQIKHDHQVSAHANLGKVYLAKGKLEEAEEELKKALRIAQSLESKRQLSDILQNLTKLSECRGDYQQAFYYQREYQQLKDSLHNAHIDRKLAEVKFQNTIEQQVKEAEIERLRNVELKREKDRSDMLLKNILPDDVAEELKTTGVSHARFFENVTVLFTDFVGFTRVSERLSPQQLVDELHACFKAFDAIVEECGIEKIKTIGDAYMAVSGMPEANVRHAENMVSAAIKIRDFMSARQKAKGEDTFCIRIGIHSGPVVAGIVGTKKFAYDIWGDTVNIAARMEQNSDPGKINISYNTCQLVKAKFNCIYRGEVEAKNKGKLSMYFVE